MECKKGYEKFGNECVKVVRKIKEYPSSWNCNSGGGVGFLSLLALLFIGLKLSGKISWSWWWVTSPLWLGFAVGIVIFIIFLIVMGVKK